MSSNGVTDLPLPRPHAAASHHDRSTFNADYEEIKKVMSASREKAVKLAQLSDMRRLRIISLEKKIEMLESEISDHKDASTAQDKVSVVRVMPLHFLDIHLHMCFVGLRIDSR